MNNKITGINDKQRPELLCPVANWEMLFAAIHNGANAIYLGFPGFNARARTADFDWDEIKQMIDTCHVYGVQVHLALNILIFQNELQQLTEIVSKIAMLGADAIIVQDLGLARLIKKAIPTQVLHASTQMTVTSELIIKNLEDLDFDRFVLGREVSLDEMRNIRSNTEKELEVFVHGALCVAYSGQCLTSESVGGRSANRGQCAQSCRLEYEMYVDGKKKDMGEFKYLVSPKDLCGIEHIPELMEMGIDSYKVEGRYKAPEYVAAAAKNYSATIDSIYNKTPKSVHTDELEKTFSRSFFTGWYHGVDHQKLVDGRFSNHRGQKIGKVKDIIKSKFPTLVINSITPLHPGDGILICDKKEQALVGSNIYQAEKTSNNTYKVSLERSVRIDSITKDCIVYINSSPQLDKSLEQSFKNRDLWKRIPLEVKINATIGKEIEFQIHDNDGNKITVLGNNKIQSAQKKSATIEDFKKVLNTNGPSPFSFQIQESNIGSDLFIHNKEIKELKKKAIEAMTFIRTDINKHLVESDTSELKIFLDKETIIKSDEDVERNLNVLIREPEQAFALQGKKLGRVYLDFKHGKAYRSTVKVLKEMGHEVFIATTRILKPNKVRLLDIIDDIKPDGVLIRNLGALQYFKDKYGENIPYKLVGDFSLNATNSLTSSYLLKKGLNSISPSYDLNRDQLLDLLSYIPGNNFEVTIHQYMPSFHMEHCVFAAFLSEGSSIKDCGMVCREHNVEIKDPYGVSHPIFPDQECRNTMFNGIPQSSGFLVKELLSKGVTNMRLEALHESNEELSLKIDNYIKLINGEIDSKQLISNIGINERYGISSGQLKKSKAYQDRKKL
jgi:putative protease